MNEQDWTEAKAPQFPSIRWTEEPVEGKENTLYLGSVVEGLYIEKKTDVGANKSTIYLLQLADGTKVNLWGSTLLDDRMSQVPMGYLVRITFKGFVKSKMAGRKPWADYTVQFAKPSMATVGSSNQGANLSAAGTPMNNQQAPGFDEI